MQITFTHRPGTTASGWTLIGYYTQLFYPPNYDVDLGRLFGWIDILEDGHEYGSSAQGFFDDPQRFVAEAHIGTVYEKDSRRLAGTVRTIRCNGIPDAKAPLLLSAVVDGPVLTLTYDEELDGAHVPDKSAFTVTGSSRTVQSVALDNRTVTLTLGPPVTQGETVRLTYTLPTDTDDRLQDYFRNEAAAIDQLVTNNTGDTTLPVFQSASLDGTKLKLKLTLTYNELLDSNSRPAGSAFNVQVESVRRTVNSVSVSGTSVELTLASAVEQGESVTFSYTAPNTNPIQDTSGNDAADLTDESVDNDDTMPPVFQSAEVIGGTLTLTYNEDLDPDSKPAGGAYTVLANGWPFTVDSVSVSGEYVVLTLNDDVPHDRPDVRLSYIAPGAKPIQDLAGNDAADLTDEAVTNNSLDTKPPELLSAEVDGATLILTYNEDLDETSEPATSAYTVSGSHSVTGVDVVGKTVELTLNPAVTYEETGITVSYTNPGTSNNPVKDEAGNEAANLTNELVQNDTPDTTRPVFDFATVSGATLTLTYDEELNSTSRPVTTAFTVSGSNGSHPVTGVNVVGATVVLTLNPAVAFEETGVTVSYTNPGTNPIEDLAGNDADNLTNEDVANDTPDPDQTGPVLQTREVNGAALTLTYNEDLDSTSVPDGGAYTVTVNGSSVAVDSVSVGGKVVSLTLSTAVVHGDVVTVAYNVPGSNPVRDDSENENNAASFSAMSVTNNTPFVDTAPARTGGRVGEPRDAVS